MDRYKPFILLGVAVVIAFLTSLFTYNWLKEKTADREVVTVETIPVAVAVADVPWGTVLKKEMVKVVPFAKGSISPDVAFSSFADLEGRVVVSPISAGEPILRSRIAADSVKAGGVTAVISEKKRAMAVKVDKVVGVSGFIHPGDKVDVLVTVTAPGTRGKMTKIVLENILVLATGPELSREGEKGKSSPVDVITLELTPEEAEKLALAMTEGRIQLALRSDTDTNDVLTRGTTVKDLLSSYRPGAEPVEPEEAAPAPSPPKRRAPVRQEKVWIVNGNQVQTYEHVLR